ncbi:MAG: spore germination protein [Oscillospiraceae bacterium]|nr:spore germination protein [Oscillospiraceae bacterium]
MLLAFELLQEAGLRLPDPVGQTVSIIGALIVGQSAVDAKVISPIAVIVVALAGIAGYTMPSQDLSTAIRLCRFGLAIAAALAGMFGIVVGTALLLWHLCSLETFGLPYMTPLAGSGGGDSGGIFIRRAPWKDLYRDKLINGGDIRRKK